MSKPSKEWMRRLHENAPLRNSTGQRELFEREIDREKVEKHIGKAEREIRDRRILEFIGIRMDTQWLFV